MTTFCKHPFIDLDPDTAQKKFGSDQQKSCNTTANLVSNNAAAGTMEDDVENRFFATRQLRLIQLAKQLTNNRQDYLKKTMGNN